MSFWRRLYEAFNPQPKGGVTRRVVLMYLNEAMRVHQYWIDHSELYQKYPSDIVNLESDLMWVRRYKAIIEFVEAQTR